MFYVYVLFSKKDLGLYIGFSEDLKNRDKQHKAGEVISTKNRLPVELIYYEAFVSRKDALAREKYLKSGYGREQSNAIIKQTLKDKRNKL